MHNDCYLFYFVSDFLAVLLGVVIRVFFPCGHLIASLFPVQCLVGFSLWFSVWISPCGSYPPLFAWLFFLFYNLSAHLFLCLSLYYFAFLPKWQCACCQLSNLYFSGRDTFPGACGGFLEHIFIPVAVYVKGMMREASVFSFLVIQISNKTSMTCHPIYSGIVHFEAFKQYLKFQVLFSRRNTDDQLVNAL